ncbi:MerR family transcriptional regulator [Pseudoduganella lutea]|uniref:MerR family transcriptional regulator n=1 Tax=Pseudoduganella lutea TaxID=321985 RepID=A0A4P6KVK6_9BURK|nr:MerR family transcriptional regulator [Pseudoduganella lutea]
MENTTQQALYRSGVAARLAGLSVETLRVWERRYGVSDTLRSERGQRLYTAGQVRRLGLLKQLVDNGHPIGTLATLPLERLEELAGVRADHAAVPLALVRVALVGETLARRIAATGNGLEVQRAVARLDGDLAPLQGAAVDVLLVELPEPDETMVPLVAAAREAAGAAAVVVLYRFCASATIRALRAQDCMVVRMPSELGELAQLCRAALAGRQLPSVDRPAGTVPAVRFDEAALATITAAGNRIACECPRHLSDLLLMVGSFERYSAQCVSRSTADAQLHRELGHAAGLARSVLETAMERLVVAEGLPMPALIPRR